MSATDALLAILEDDKRYGEFVGSLNGGLLPCASCRHSWPHFDPKDRSGGHCYMFREPPLGSFCGQFKRVAPQLNGNHHE